MRAFRERFRGAERVRVDAPVAALTNTFQPPHSGPFQPFWDGTPAHSSGPRAALQGLGGVA